jgi:outer membrane protein TolC
LAARQAKAGLAEARSKSLPQLSAVYALDRSDDLSTQLEGSNQAVVKIEQTVYPFSADWIRAQQQAAILEAATLARLETSADVALAVKQLYFSISNADEAIASLGRVEDQLQRLRETILPRFAVGRVPRFDAIKVKTAISDLARTEDQIAADRAAKKAELAQIIGGPADADLRLKALAALPESPDIAAVEGQLPANPTLRVLEQQVFGDELGLKAAKRTRFPDLVTGFEYGDSGTTTSSMPPSWDVTLGLRLPLYDWGLISARVSQQEALRDLSRNRLGIEEQRLRTQLVEASSNARAHLADYRRSTDLLAETHESALAAVDQYKRGAMGILEATDAMNLWLQTLLNGRSAYYSYLADLARLERLSGGATKVSYGD